MHPAQRRHQSDAAASALRKPFRSPLSISTNKARPSSTKQDERSPESSIRGTVHTTQSPSLDTELTNQFRAATLVTHIPDSRDPQSSSPHLTSPSRFSSHAVSRDGEFIILQKRYRSLCQVLKELVTELDTSKQALEIVQHRRDDDLERSILKWRNVSRDAAEQLFLCVKDRANCTGSTRTWSSVPRQRSPGLLSYENENDVADLTEDQKEELEIAREDLGSAMERQNFCRIKPPSDLEDDEAFTIHKMLRQLNIDLDILGYDAENEQWRD